MLESLAVVVPDDIGEAVNAYPQLVGALVSFVVAFVVVLLVGRLIVVPLFTRALRARGFNETIRGLAGKVTSVLVFFAAVAVAFTVAGFGQFLAAFATLGGALALAVGIASQNLISNFVAGVFILKDRPFEAGDWIEWGDESGVVQEIDLRVTTLKTFDNEKITVPNSDLSDGVVKNPVAYERLRQKFVFGIGYDDDVDRATDIIVEEAERHDEILDDPGVSVRLTELGDSSVGLQSRFWIDDPSRSDFVRVRSEYVQAVKERFDAEGIDIPYPYRELTGTLGLDGELETEPIETTD